MKVLDLFSGIGGFSLGLERAGMKTVAFCEIEEFPRKVLAKHWPDIPIYDDVRTLTKERLDNDGLRSIDVICGGYPCQPFSLAGKRGGEKDDRHLWPEFNRLISELQPRWVVCENVTGHISMGLDQVLSDLEGQGYSCESFIIPACAVNAEHRRDRVWIIAYLDSERLQERQVVSRMEEEENGQAWREAIAICSGWESDPDILRIKDGIPGRVDRIKALGNAVVPQIPEIIGRAILNLQRGIA